MAGWALAFSNYTGIEDSGVEILEVWYTKIVHYLKSEPGEAVGVDISRTLEI